MKARKLVCLMMTVFLLLPMMVGCGNSELVGEYITGVVTALDEKGATVEVCGDSANQLGETAKIIADELSTLNIVAGDELRVKVEKVVDGIWSPTKIYAEAVQVIALGEGHQTDGETAVYSYNGTDYGPYQILALSEIEISPDFPTVQAMKEKSYQYDQFSNDRTSLLRVVKIEDEIVYLSGVRNIKSVFALVGIPDVFFAVGDHVKISSSVGYRTDYEVIWYADELTKFEVADEASIAREYYNSRLVALKPVIYLYPESEITASVKLDLDGNFTCTYPDYGTDGWQNFTAKPDGTLIAPDGSQYYCLYWEGKLNLEPDWSKGFCVKGSDTAVFLEQVLAEMGLTPREANEFIIFWLPMLQNNPYNLISFQGDNYDAAAKLEITPTPDSVLRIYMTAKPLTAPVRVEPQTFAPFERNGFTVVEWGGGIIQ